MKGLVIALGHAVGGGAALFFIALIITFIIKKIVIAFAKEDRKSSIEQNFSVIKISAIYGAIAAGLSLIGIGGHFIGYYSIPIIIVADLVIANSK